VHGKSLVALSHPSRVQDYHCALPITDLARPSALMSTQQYTAYLPVASACIARVIEPL
jgi:hypothetical protein